MTTIIRHDKDGNAVKVASSGVYLNLMGERHEKKIFDIKHGDYHRKVRERHVFKAIPNRPMIGFNYLALQMIQDNTPKRHVYVTYKGKEHKIRIGKLINGGKLLYFKSKGYEPQVFYPISELTEEDRTG